MTPRSPSTGSFCDIALAASLMTLKVPTRLTCTTRAKFCNGMTPCLPIVFSAVAMPAQFTVIRSGACATAVSIAAWTLASSVTSAGAKEPPSSAARSAPAEVGRSRRTTCAPAFDNSVAVASPSPLAPPVMIALQPSILICCLLHHDEHSARLDLLPSGHFDPSDRAGRGRGHRVLHLHRLEHDERLALDDVIAGADQDANDRPWHRRHERTRHDIVRVVRKARHDLVRRRPQRRVDIDCVIASPDVERTTNAV